MLSAELFSGVFNDFKGYKVVKAPKILLFYRQKRSASKHLKISTCIYSKKYV